MSDDTRVDESKHWVIVARRSMSSLVVIGDFPTEDEAWEWAHDHVPNLPYSVTAFMVAKMNDTDPAAELEFAHGWMTQDGYLA